MSVRGKDGIDSFCGPTTCQSPSEFTQKVQTGQPLLCSLWVSPFPPFTFGLRQTRLSSCLSQSEFSLSSSLCSFLSFYLEHSIPNTSEGWNLSSLGGPSVISRSILSSNCPAERLLTYTVSQCSQHNTLTTAPPS